MMKQSFYIFLFACFTYLGIASAQISDISGCIVFQPDNRTTILSAEDINRIWSTLEKLAGESCQVMDRQSFMDFATSNGLHLTGSNLRSDPSIRQRLCDGAANSALIFTRITRWGNHFNVSMEKITLPSFQMTRATLPLSAKINTLEQLLDKMPDLLNNLRLSDRIQRKPEMPLALIMPQTSQKQLDIFYASLQKHLSEAGIPPVILSQPNGKKDIIQISATLDSFENKTQTLDLPMQNRKIIQTSISLEGHLNMKSGDDMTTFTFSKADSHTAKPEDDQKPNEKQFIDTVARDVVSNIIRKLNHQ